MAKVLWKEAQRKVYGKATQEIDGDALAVVVNENNVDVDLFSSKRALIDGNWCIINSFFYGGVGNNRIYLKLTQDTSEHIRIG